MNHLNIVIEAIDLNHLNMSKLFQKVKQLSNSLLLVIVDWQQFACLKAKLLRECQAANRLIDKQKPLMIDESEMTNQWKLTIPQKIDHVKPDILLMMKLHSLSAAKFVFSSCSQKKVTLGEHFTKDNQVERTAVSDLSLAGEIVQEMILGEEGLQ